MTLQRIEMGKNNNAKVTTSAKYIWGVSDYSFDEFQGSGVWTVPDVKRWQTGLRRNSHGVDGPDNLLLPHPQPGMAGWKPSFERGISNFRLEKYEEALACFNEVRLLHPLFDGN